MSDEKKRYDWRILGYSFLTADVPAAYPGGPSHKAGSPVFISCLTRTAQGELIGFIQPSPPAMAIDIAIKAALKADSLRQTLVLIPSVTPHGRGKDVHFNTTPVLYDYFENCMISVTFSVQALDIFCNEVIAAYVKGTLPVKLNKKTKNLNKLQLQENLSLKMKIGTVLPKIFSISSPEELDGNKIWNQYIELERVRNTTIHLNSINEHPGIDIDKESLFFEFFKSDAKKYPKYTLDIIDYFKPNIKNQAHEKWVDEARKILDF